MVLVVVESLSAQFLGAYGGHLPLTPNLDALAGESLVFTQLYATGNRTVRGLEAVTLSLPPTPGYSIVKRPGNGGLFTIATPFRERGYDVRFLYGGYGFFDNMNAFFGGNGFEIVDRAALAADEVTFANAWGVADEDLFRRALREGGSLGGGGSAFLLAAAHDLEPPALHLPRRSRADPVEDGPRRRGPVHRLGDRRLRAPGARALLVLGHRLRDRGGPLREQRREDGGPGAEVPDPAVDLRARAGRPGRVDTLASQIDVAPTLLGLLGFGYRSRFFGRDLLEPSGGEPRALLATYQRLGLLQNGLLTILSPGKEVEAFRVNLARGSQKAAPPEAQSLSDTIAYYQAASFAWREGLLRTSPPGG